MIIPTSLIMGGSLLSRSTLENDLQRDIRKGIGKGFSTKLDDYFRYAPMAELAVANAIGLKSKNHWFDQAKNLFLIDVASFITVRTLKSVVKRSRPNNQYIYNSFPSGHTTLAFSNATMVFSNVAGAGSSAIRSISPIARALSAPTGLPSTISMSA